MIEEIPDGAKRLTREALFYPGITDQNTVHVSVSEIVGTMAKWAIQQSPYAVPDNLEVVCKQLDHLLCTKHIFGVPSDDDVRLLTIKGMDFVGKGVISVIDRGLHNMLHSIPEYLAWNERKNGNQQPFNFTSSYDVGKRNPDDDFIDLGALERNVAMSLVQRYIVDSRDGWIPDGEGGLRKLEVEDPQPPQN